MRALILRRAALIEEGHAGSVLLGPRGDARPDAHRRVLGAQRAALHRARRDGRRGGPRLRRAPRRAARRPAAPRMPGRDGAEGAERRAGGDLPRHHARARSRAVYDVVVVGAGPPASRPRCMPRRRACRSSCSTSTRSAARPASRRGSRTTSGSPRGSPDGARRPGLNQAAEIRVGDRHPAQSRTDCGMPTAMTATRSDSSSPTAASCGPRPWSWRRAPRYRRPADRRTSPAFEGAGVSYWASPVEAKLCEGEEVAVVGRRQLGGTGSRVPLAEGQAAASHHPR